MKGGRKNLKRATKEKEHNLVLEDGQSIMQVVSLKGSNLIEVMDVKGQKSLALFPAKFQKSIWIKRGSCVVIDESGKEKALQSGSKVTCIVSQVLYYDQVRALRKSPQWTESFKSLDDCNRSVHKNTWREGDNEPNSNDANELALSLEANNNKIKTLEFQEEDVELDSSDDDGLPPLEANTNRIKLPEFHVDAESNSGSESDS